MIFILKIEIVFELVTYYTERMALTNLSIVFFPLTQSNTSE